MRAEKRAEEGGVDQSIKSKPHVRLSIRPVPLIRLDTAQEGSDRPLDKEERVLKRSFTQEISGIIRFMTLDSQIV